VPPKDFVDSIESVESGNASLHRMTFSDGVVREYKLVLPRNYNPEFTYPLAIGLHGVGGTASSIRTLMKLESGLTPSIMAYPQGLSLGVGTSSAWNAGTCCEPATILQPNDVRFISRLIDNIQTQLRVDKSRVWAIGFSNGGMMAYRLACEISEQITGVGVGSGSLAVGTCTPARKFSVIHIHGELDEDVPLNGGGPYRTQSATYSVDSVANAVGCTNDAAKASANTRVWQCPDSMEMKLVVDTNQGHDWNNNWTDIMAQFLHSHPRS
jgi:polyhydroxybutyrate depolymerase